MGGLGSVFADAVEAARLGVESLHVPIVWRAWRGQDLAGEPEVADGVTLSALVNEGAQQRMGPDGRVVNAKACVVLMPSASGEAPPAVSLRDRLTLPSGLSGPIVEVEAVAANPDTGAPLARVVWIG